MVRGSASSVIGCARSSWGWRKGGGGILWWWNEGRWQASDGERTATQAGPNVWSQLEGELRDDQKPVVVKWQLAVSKAVFSAVQEEEKMRVAVMQDGVSKSVDF